MKKLTLEETKAMVAEILLSNPDERFGEFGGPARGRACLYFEESTGEPACVVGHVFSRLGMTLEDLHGPVMSANTTKMIVLEYAWKPRIEDDAAGFLDQVQREQDEGLTWREVYDEFFGEEAEDEADSTQAP